MDALAVQQEATGKAIQQLISNFNKDSADRKSTASYFQRRLTELQELWNEFDARHKSCEAADPDRENRYFTSRYYTAISHLVLKYESIFKSKIDDFIRKEASTSKAGSSAQPSQDVSTAIREPQTATAEDSNHTNISDKPVFLVPGIAESSYREDNLGVTPSELTKAIRRQHGSLAALARILEGISQATPSMSKHHIQVKLESINRQWAKLEEGHAQIIELCEEPTTVGYRVEEYISLDDQVQDIKILLYQKLEELAAAPPGPPHLSANTVVQNAGAVATSQMKLPRISLPVFNGDYLQWRQFHDLFTQMVHNQNMGRCQKMWYLKTNLTGEPEKLIRHYSISEENYTAAWDTLVNRYNNMRIIVTALLNKLIAQPSIQQEGAAAIKTLHDTTKECLRGLNNLGIPTENWDPLVVHLLMKRLDKNTHVLFEQSLDNPREVQTLEKLLNFLETRFQSLEALGTKGKYIEEVNRKPPTARALAVTTNKATKCSSCKANHSLFACPQFLKLLPKSRLELVRNNKLCINCLRPGHNASSCTSRSCTRCAKKHNTLLHLEQGPQGQQQQSSNNNSQVCQTPVTQSHNTGLQQAALSAQTPGMQRSLVLLSTVMIQLTADDGRSVQCRAILDSGSQLNFITQRMAKELNLAKIPDAMGIQGIGGAAQRAQHRVNVKLVSNATGFSTRLEAFVLPKIIPNHPAANLNIEDWSIPHNIKLADPDFNRANRVDFLIGAEIYHQLLSVGQIKLGEKLPIIQNTLLGWIVCGKVGDSSQHEAPLCGICSEDQELSQQLEKFWKLEQEESPRKTLSSSEQKCEDFFEKTTRRDGQGRFIVSLPFKENQINLGESKDIALQRYLSLERKFIRDPSLKHRYSDFMKEYIELGHMQLADVGSVKAPYYFLPHHAVIKPDSTTTKLRVVFDASAKTSTNVSLNELLHVGPVIQEELFTTLIRFRMPRYVFTADIEKMYRQIRLREEDQKYHLIWWRQDPKEPLKCYQLCTVTYGTTSAPYLAIKCLQTLAESGKDSYPLGAEVLRTSFYVDDVMTGSDSITTALSMQGQLKELLQTAGFKLRKWCANHPKLLQNLPKEDMEVQLDFQDKDQPHVKTLGLTWLPKSDSFKIKTTWNERHKITKRTVCSDAAHLFDPLGLVGPATVIAKMFLQKLWRLKLDWDASLPVELHTEWTHFREELKTLDSISIVRHASLHKEAKLMQLHVFADASEKAYGAAVYIRIIDKGNHITAQLLCSRSRVAPLKTLTIPRLELCAARLAVDLAQRVRRDLSGTILVGQTFYWTDSEIVLCWINSASSSLHTFVANRVAAIQEHTTPQQWRHVKSKENPADVLSRGMSPRKLKDCGLWFYGPTFLHGQESIWPPVQLPKVEHIPESRVVLASMSEQHSQNVLAGINHGNSFRKLQRIVAYIKRFSNELRRRRTTGAAASGKVVSDIPPISAEELERSLICIIKQMQQSDFKDELDQLGRRGETHKSSKLSSLTPFIDEQGVIRVGGRLEASDLSYDAKHQIVVSNTHPLTKLLMKSIHEENKHPGPQALLAITRQKFWPLRGKTIARSVVQHCIRCFKAKPQLMSQLMGNLPAQRIQPTRPFVNSGVDFCGPVWTHYKIRGKRPHKSYIAVFCCFSTKAVHLELVTELTTDAFIGALKRFIGRRGHCRHLHCDNATNFTGAQAKLGELKNAVHSEEAKKRISSLCSTRGIDFHFIPPRAPHFGGLWEAAVKSAKGLLLRSVTSASLTYEELETVVIEVEAVLNSRPLTPMSADPNDLSALTPGHFIIGEPLVSTIHPEATPAKHSLLTRWKLVSHIKNEFWKRWSAEYLNELQQRYKWQTKQENIKPGTMVILKEDNLPPMKWPLARVVKIYNGDDNLTRAVDVRTARGTFRRSISRIAPLPVDEPIEASLTETSTPIEASWAEAAAETSSAIPTEDAAASRPMSRPAEAREDGATSTKRVRFSPMSTIATVLLTCLLLPVTHSTPVEVTSFMTPPGIYFENLGAARIISNEWNIIAYYDMAGYWMEFEGLMKGQKSLANICAQLDGGDPCATTLAQIQHLVRDIEENNELLATDRTNARRRRGALNIIGNIANSLFGVLDSEYADKMSKTIDDTKRNEDYLLQLIRNQTTIIDSSVNIMKKTQEEVNMQFGAMQAQVNELSNGIHKIQEELRRQRLSTLFTTLTTQILLVSSNIQRMQASLIDVFSYSHHGRISPKLITPHQLRQQLGIIKAHLRPSLKLPQVEDNILQLYTLMDVAARAVKQRIIFKISVPLLNTEEFELLKVLPVPFLVNGTFVNVVPSSPFLVVNLHRDQYYPITDQELQACVSLREDDHMCRQNHPIYQRGSNQSSCEMDLINDKLVPSVCKVEVFSKESQWIQLNNPNEWLFSVKEPEMVKIACGSNVTSRTLTGAGILRMHGSCIVKQRRVILQGHNIYPTVLRSSYVPSGNITQVVIPEQLSRLTTHRPAYRVHLAELEELKKQIRQQMDSSYLPSSLPAHDAHQYAIAYIGSAISIGVLIYVVWRLRSYTYSPPRVPTTSGGMAETRRPDPAVTTPSSGSSPAPMFTIQVEQ